MNNEGKVLTAVYPILYHSHQYAVGDALPANDEVMVDAWLTAGTAVWLGETTPAVKAEPVTALPGLAGESPASEPDVVEEKPIVGRVPKTRARSKKA